MERETKERERVRWERQIRERERNGGRKIVSATPPRERERHDDDDDDDENGGWSIFIVRTIIPWELQRGGDKGYWIFRSIHPDFAMKNGL